MKPSVTQHKLAPGEYKFVLREHAVYYARRQDNRWYLWQLLADDTARSIGAYPLLRDCRHRVLTA